MTRYHWQFAIGVLGMVLLLALAYAGVFPPVQQ